jgi:hypothetical protein
MQSKEKTMFAFIKKFFMKDEPTPQSVQETPEQRIVDLEAMTKKELVECASALGLTLSMRMKKAEMIKEIEKL